MRLTTEKHEDFSSSNENTMLLLSIFRYNDENIKLQKIILFHITEHENSHIAQKWAW
ncbi:hypothetical protein XNA1_4500042 [Xenorhabdus nematophila str. Anatoliense]|nr:hypothetical protein XNA1_4500042 [Xenorhabdus nematophila str. Anatoliense]